MFEPEAVELVPIKKLTKDLKQAAVVLSDQEARYLTDFYYTAQENRIRAAAQVRETVKSGEPNAVISWLEEQNYGVEQEIKKALGYYVKNHKVGAWLTAQLGVGPVLAAGLLAHIDIRKAHTAGAIWRYAGIDPTIEWKKSTEIESLIKSVQAETPMDLAIKVAPMLNRRAETIMAIAQTFAKTEEDGTPKEVKKEHVARALKSRPFNAALLVLCWKMGESFVKVSGNEKSLYGFIYKQRKEYETRKNEAGDYREQALKCADRVGKTTEAYKYNSGEKTGTPMLAPGHIHSRAKRYAVRIFLSHLHEVWYFLEFNKLPPRPFALAILGHTHEIYVPEIDKVPGLLEAKKAAGLVTM